MKETITVIALLLITWFIDNHYTELSFLTFLILVIYLFYTVITKVTNKLNN